jgi:arginyl-tRNA synthetase
VPFPEASDLAPRLVNLAKPYLVRSLNCTANKALHLGHLRNTVLGAATAGSLETLGARVLRHCILEDTGRFMTEAMAALRDFERSGEPANQQLKPDHFIGACYRRYREKDTPARKEISRARRWLDSDSSGKRMSVSAKGALATTGYDACGDEADDLMAALVRGEDEALMLRARVRVMALSGQQETLQRIGVVFDYCDYESAEDPGLSDFVASCIARGLLHRNRKGELEYITSKRRKVRLVNHLGFAEESLRLLSFNCRLAKTWTANHMTIIIAGSEWKNSMTAYAEILSLLSIKNSLELYAPTFYGMVLLNGKKMASSIGTGLLVDDLIDKLAEDKRIGTLSAQCGTGDRSDEFAAMITKCFLLSFGRTDTIDFTFEAFNSAEENPGWSIAAAWAAMAGDQTPQSSGTPSAECRKVLLEAVARISFEAVIARAKEIAARVLDGLASEADKKDFTTMVRALSVAPRRSEFVYSRVAALGGTPT